VGEASGRAERDAALAMLDGLRRPHGCRPLTLGADKGYDDGAFLVDVRKRAITPPPVMEGAIRGGAIEPKCERSWARWLCRHGVDRKDMDTSQRKRKPIEEAFGWVKRVAGQWRAGRLMKVGESGPTRRCGSRSDGRTSGCECARAEESGGITA
jgi:hypothetical protein